jgi:hypothetical protein
LVARERTPLVRRMLRSGRDSPSWRIRQVPPVKLECPHPEHRRSLPQSIQARDPATRDRALVSRPTLFLSSKSKGPAVTGHLSELLTPEACVPPPPPERGPVDPVALRLRCLRAPGSLPPPAGFLTDREQKCAAPVGVRQSGTFGFEQPFRVFLQPPVESLWTVFWQAAQALPAGGESGASTIPQASIRRASKTS